MPRPSIFLSYATEDRPVADRLASVLRRGYEVFIDFESIPGGVEWVREIESSIHMCDAMVALVSERSVDSKWVTRETILADKLRKPIFPALLSGQIPLQLIERQFVDFRGHFDQASADLLQAISTTVQPAELSESSIEELLGRALLARLGGNALDSDAALRSAIALAPQLPEDVDAFWALVTEAETVGGTREAVPQFLSISEHTTDLGPTKSGGRKRRWTIALTDVSEFRDKIDFVEYHLHPTFKNRVQRIRDPTYGFALTRTGWGTFPVGVVVQFVGGEKRYGSYDLTFRSAHSELIELLDSPRELLNLIVHGSRSS